MTEAWARLPMTTMTVDAGTPTGPLELWRHCVGHGGINALPLPEGVVQGIRKLQPRLIRTFIQECFDVYPEHDRFDWTTLDPYMDALARTGAKLVAAITIKPPVLFPTIDHAVWQPTSVAEWQQVIRRLVTRYSVERPYVTYWEIGNETDIGESGGAPYLIRDPEAYSAWYRMTSQAVLEAFPAAKVGGPAACWIDNEPLPGLIASCRESGAQLDFISWHIYNDDPQRHALGVERAKELLSSFPGPRPEMLVTEWGTAIGSRVSVEEMAFTPRRAALTAASILAMLEAGLDWSFYYHLWDQAFYPDSFQRFFSADGSAHMLEHWNEVPHRLGLFGVGGEVRPQYFVYQMLSRMGGERLAVHLDQPDVPVLAARGEHSISTLLANIDISTLLANIDPETSQDRLVALHYAHLAPGPKVLTAYRIDADRRWSAGDFELQPVERRSVYAPETFRCQVYAPADSVVMVRLADETQNT